MILVRNKGRHEYKQTPQQYGIQGRSNINIYDSSLLMFAIPITITNFQDRENTQL